MKHISECLLSLPFSIKLKDSQYFIRQWFDRLETGSSLDHLIELYK